MAKKKNNLVVEPIEKVETEQVETTYKEVIVGEVIGCEKLNVRKEASIESEVITIITAGTKVIVEDIVNNFYKTDNGYVMKDYIKIS